MKKTLVILLVLTFAMSAGAFARSLGLPNELLNGSWESGLFTPGWTKIAGAIYYEGDPNWSEPPRAPGESDIYYLGKPCTNLLRYAGAEQSVAKTAGTYTVDLSGWLCVLDTGSLPSWIEMSLKVDGVVVDTFRITATESEITWTYHEILWTGYVASNVTAYVYGTVDGTGGTTTSYIMADGFDLESEIVPEPCTLMALAGGLVGLVIRRRK